MSIPVITPEQMYAAEQRAFDAGVDSFDLMQVAGKAVAALLHERFPDGDISVLCGPGGNGGDGFVAAAWLAGQGREVRVCSLLPVNQLSGDAGKAAALWIGEVHALEAALAAPAAITLDALFGGGLSRPLDGVPAELAGRTSGTTVSVDVPSGLDGLTAQSLGCCFTADLTVTFAALRPAHVLEPGRSFCGDVRVADIGVAVPDQVQLVDDWSEPAENTARFASIGDLASRYAAPRSPARNMLERIAGVAAETRQAFVVDGDLKVCAWPDGRMRIFRRQNAGAHVLQ